MGHLIVGDYCKHYTDLEEIWIVVTPQSPFKKRKDLLNDAQRLKMVELATENFPHLKPCDVEMNMPQPNYTFKTLKVLQNDFPENEFSIIMGEDNLEGLYKWKEADFILENYRILVYPRIHKKKKTYDYKKYNIQKINAPIIELSSTFIRNSIKNNQFVSSMVPFAVSQYISENNLYQ